MSVGDTAEDWEVLTGVDDSEAGTEPPRSPGPSLLDLGATAGLWTSRCCTGVFTVLEYRQEPPGPTYFHSTILPPLNIKRRGRPSGGAAEALPPPES